MTSHWIFNNPPQTLQAIKNKNLLKGEEALKLKNTPLLVRRPLSKYNQADCRLTTVIVKTWKLKTSKPHLNVIEFDRQKITKFKLERLENKKNVIEQFYKELWNLITETIKYTILNWNSLNCKIFNFESMAFCVYNWQYVSKTRNYWSFLFRKWILKT